MHLHQECRSPKSRLTSFLLTFVLGPFGLFYTSVSGALVLSFATIASIITAPNTDEVVLIGSMLTYWILAMGMGDLATMMHNRRLVN